jgi:hypothetical protein
MGESRAANGAALLFTPEYSLSAVNDSTQRVLTSS